MLRKMYIMLLSAGFISVSAYSQTIKEKIDKAHNDPKTAERAAKADALVIDKKKICDSTMTIKSVELQTNEKPPKRKRKAKTNLKI